ARLTHKFRKLKNHRKDLYHKTTRNITNNHGDIYAESLNVKELSEESESKTMKKQFRDAAWSIFMNMLSYKAEEAGTVIQKVYPAYTSQICSRCGNIVEKDLSVRIHECPYCDLRLDRDINAARNILKRGLGAARQVRGNRQISEPLPVSTYGI
ncbi:MAG: transposase, partial [Thermoplasmata archaeon]|nr:transposase [Thermoplasmata archaeon]